MRNPASVIAFGIVLTFCSRWSLLGTVVMKVVVTDADQPGTPHTKIHYQIASESNPDGLFYINSQTGEVMVQQGILDREVSGYTIVTIRNKAAVG